MKAYGNAIKKALALTLLLSLSPCAFAEGETVVDTGTTVFVNQFYNGDLSITDTGSITFQSDSRNLSVDGSLSNAGSINSAESVHVSSELNNSGSIMSKGERVNVRGNSIVNQKGGSISLNGTDYADIDADGTLENGGSISLNGTVYADIFVYGTLENSGSIEISSRGTADILTISWKITGPYPSRALGWPLPTMWKTTTPLRSRKKA